MIRVLMFGMFDRTYPRNRIVQAAMRSRGIDLRICHEPMWELTRHKTCGYTGLWNRVRLVLRLLLAYLRLPLRLAPMRRDFDVIWVGFPGHADMLLAWLVGRLTGRPVMFDAFISWYDSAVRDRRLFPKKSFTARLLRFFDIWSCRLADHVVLDTPAHARFFERMFKVPAAKLLSLPVGADQTVYHPQPAEAGNRREGDDSPFTVLQYAEFTPLHGGRHVLDAAAQLRDVEPNIRFVLIGDGGPFDRALRQQAAERRLHNVTFHDFMSEAELVQHIAGADVCLGIFGDTPKARRVVPNKVYQCMAMAKVVITGRTPAVEEELTHLADCWLCNPADGADLAQAIVALRDQPPLCEKLAAGALARFRATFGVERIGEILETHLSRIVSNRAEPDAAVASSPRPAPGRL